MKIGDKVKVEEKNANAWGYKVPAIGKIIGEDPQGGSAEVFAVKLDQGDSIYESIGCHKARLTPSN